MVISVMNINLYQPHSIEHVPLLILNDVSCMFHPIFSLILEKEYLLKKNLTTTFKLGQLRLFVQLQKMLKIWLVRVLWIYGKLGLVMLGFVRLGNVRFRLGNFRLG